MPKLPEISKKLYYLLIFIFISVIFASGIFGGYFFANKNKSKENNYISLDPTLGETTQKDKYLTFLLEIYSIINQNYWDKISEDQLVELYRLGLEKLTAQQYNMTSKTKVELETLLLDILNNLETSEQKKEFAAKLSDIVLANLKPFGRSRLYSKKQQVDLQNTVRNINTEINQYDILEIEKEATKEQIDASYDNKISKLNEKLNTATNAAEKSNLEQQISQVNQAFKVLGDQDSKKVYDESGVEPTMDWELLTPELFYLHINKFSPTTLEELETITKKVDAGDTLDTIILDLQDNLGGAVDLLPYFLGPFIGKDQYAYQFYKQGQKIDFITKTGWMPSLIRYKKVIILINKGSQSSAEIMASTLKKYNVGIVVGTTTKGWGTIERIFPLQTQMDETETFSVFLVHSLTLREDGQPIEGNGVDPLINIENSDWEKELLKYFNYPALIEAVKQKVKIN